MAKLQKENEQKRDEYQELWTKSNASLLEKEMALETVKQLQSIGPSKEQEKLSASANELEDEIKQQKEQIYAMSEEGGLLREMNELLGSEREEVVVLAKEQEQQLANLEKP